VVVTNKAASTASIIDVASGTTLATLPTGTGPHEVAITADGGLAVVTDYGSRDAHTLTVIDVPGRRVARTVDLGAYTRPHGVAFLPGDSLVAVTSEASRHVVIVRVADGSIVKAISTDHDGSHMLAVTSDGRRIYTGDIRDGTVSELDVTAGRRTRSFAVPPEPEAINVTPDGREVWVGSNSEGLVSVVATATGDVTTAAREFGWPYRILYTPDSRLALLPDLRREELRILERSSRRELARLTFPGAGPQGITITPDGRWAFQSLSGQRRVAVINLGTREVVQYLETGEGPDGVGYTTRVVTGR
jgi:DNA-binding beta-propeller fold protein YncE